MQKLNYNLREVWLGYHEEVGPFLYDKGSQSKLSEKKVRLYKLKTEESSVFLKNILKQNLVKAKPNLEKDYKEKINKYLEILTKRIKNKRQTHCFECKSEIDSVDFLICTKCKWIRCLCGTCGCDWSDWSGGSV